MKQRASDEINERLEQLLKRHDAMLVELDQDTLRPLRAPNNKTKKKQLNKRDVANYLNVPLTQVNRWIEIGVLTEGYNRKANNGTTWTRQQIEALGVVLRSKIALRRLQDSYDWANRLVSAKDLEYYYGVDNQRIYQWVTRKELPEPDVRISKRNYWFWETIYNHGLTDAGKERMIPERRKLLETVTEQPYVRLYMHEGTEFFAEQEPRSDE